MFSHLGISVYPLSHKQLLPLLSLFLQTILPSKPSNTDVVRLLFHYVICLSELVYDDVFTVWETIWAAKCVSSSHFVLFIALSLVEIYRDIILENNMDFTDIIKFFNGKTCSHTPLNSTDFTH